MTIVIVIDIHYKMRNLARTHFLNHFIIHSEGDCHLVEIHFSFFFSDFIALKF